MKAQPCQASPYNHYWQKIFSPMLGLGLPLFTQRVVDVSDPPCSPSDPARALLVEHGVQPPPEMSARTRIQHLAQAACWRHGSAHQHRVLENKKGKGERSRHSQHRQAHPAPWGGVYRGSPLQPRLAASPHTGLPLKPTGPALPCPGRASPPPPRLPERRRRRRRRRKRRSAARCGVPHRP